MIKLIASDMDGTLLNSKGDLPKDFYEVLNELHKKGIIFAAASGRQYYTLADNFHKGKDEILFVAENGAIAMYRDKEIYSKTLDRSTVMKVIEDARKIEGCDIVLCGKNSAYVESNADNFFENTCKYYHRNILVKNFEEVEDGFLKIALFDRNGSQHTYEFMEPLWGQRLKVIKSGPKWVDVGRDDVDKGTTLKHVQEILNINFDETMVFGDYFNDVSLLESAYYSYVMKNAPEEMKKHGRFIADSNDDDGVIKTIRKEILDDSYIL